MEFDTSDFPDINRQKTPLILPATCASFSHFSKDVWNMVQTSSMRDMDNSSETNESAFTLFKNCSLHAQKSCQKVDEYVLMDECFCPLLSFGDVVIESISDKMRNDHTTASIASISKSANFLTDVNALSFVRFSAPHDDFYPKSMATIRRRTKNDVNGVDYMEICWKAGRSKKGGHSKKYLSKDAPLSVDRLAPHNQLAFIQYKNWTDDIHEFDLVVPSFVEHLDSLLQVSPHRQVVFGAVTNFRQCQFIAVVAKHNDTWANGQKRHMAYYSIVTEGVDNVARELAAFVTTSVEVLGGDFPHLTADLFRPEVALGRGSTGFVTYGKCVSSDEMVVVKTSTDSAELLWEATVLSFVHFALPAGALDRHIPRINDEQQQLFYKVMCGSCNVFSDRFLAPDWPASLSYMLGIWDIARQLHSVGVCHCDIRPANCGRFDDSSNSCALMDFGSARFYRPLEALVAADAKLRWAYKCLPVLVAVINSILSLLSYVWRAAGRLLRVMLSKLNLRIRPAVRSVSLSCASKAVLQGDDFMPADDGCSVILCALGTMFCVHPELMVFCRLLTDVERSAGWQWKFRENFFDLIKSHGAVNDGGKAILCDVQEALARLNTERIRHFSAPEDVDAIVRSALHRIYDLPKMGLC